MPIGGEAIEDERALIARAAGGDRDAQDRLIARHLDAVHAAA